LKSTLCTGTIGYGGTIVITLHLGHPKTVNARTIDLTSFAPLSTRNTEDNSEHENRLPPETDEDGEDWKNS